MSENTRGSDYNQILFLKWLLSILYNSINVNENCGATGKWRGRRRRKGVDIKNTHTSFVRAHVCVYNHDRIIQIKLRTLIMSRCRRLKSVCFYGKIYERNKLIIFYLNEIVLFSHHSSGNGSLLTHHLASRYLHTSFIYDEGFIQKFPPSLNILINIASMNACYMPQNQLVMEGGILMSFLLIIAVRYTLNCRLTPSNSHLHAHVNKMIWLQGESNVFL